MKRDKRHIPVLLKAVLAVLEPRPGQVFVDCTLGIGGHSGEILRRIGPGGRLLGIDLDLGNMAIAEERLRRVEGGATFELFHNNFAGIANVIGQAGILDYSMGGGVDGVLADVGVASTQIDDPERGFSYRRPGPLDMRMDPTRGKPAHVLVNQMSEEELVIALNDFGDETDAPRIARLIVQRRAVTPIMTTDQLAAIVCEARDFTLERALGAKLHPAARTFQALRIMVNRELANLDRLLTMLPSVLRSGGVAAIISFHSGEDRRVKASFRDGFRGGVYSEISPDPIVADPDECGRNPRSAPAKLRWVRRA